jgi:hypothetical protein
MPQDDLNLDDLLLPEGGIKEKEDSNPAISQDEVHELREQIKLFEKEKKGLLNGIQEERRKRQEIKGRLDQVTTTVNSMLEQREQLISSQSQKDEDVLENITLEVDEDGEYILPGNAIKQVLEKRLAPLMEENTTLKQELAMLRDSTTSQQEYNAAVQAMVGEKPEYDAAHRVYQSARKWVSDRVAEWSYNNGVNRKLNSGEALSILGSDVTEEFQQQFPGLDLFTIVTAEDSQPHFQRMLAQTAEALQKVEPTPTNSRYQRVMQKPSSLGKSANAKGGEPTLAEKVGQLSATDIMNLDDGTADALTRFIREDEEKDGIDW